jgi:predicted component of viral defense system (DUF524 family)
LIKFFYYDEKIQIPENFNYSYFKHLDGRGKVVFVKKNLLALRDFCGYIGDTLYIPKKVEKLLQLDDSQEYLDIFSNLFSAILKHFNEDILFQLFPTRFGITEHLFNSSKIFQLNTILKHRDSTLFALNILPKNAHRRLVEERVHRNFQDVSYIDDTILLDILENPQHWQNRTPRKSRQVLQYDNFESVDTPENRFIKFFLEKLSGTIENLIDFTEKIPIQRILLKSIKYQIESFWGEFPIDKVGELKVFPYNSQVLLKRDGYKELFYLYNRLHYSFKPSFLQNLDNAISIKDISSLWEYYVMSKLIEQFGEIKSQKLETDIQLKNETYEKASIEFKSGLKIMYQHIIKSYSNIHFRPDFYIEFQGKRVVLDAKFRVLEANRTEILKNMHYYKDSLKLDSALAVVIGKEQSGEFYSENGTVKKIYGFENIFNFSGVGYISLNLMELL